MLNINEIKKALLDRDGSTCSICGVRLNSDNLNVDHIFPYGLGGGNELNNLRLVCKSCNCKYANSAFNAYEFEKYIFSIIQKNENFRNTELEVGLGDGNRYDVDIVTERREEKKWERIAIEIKYTTSMTIDRIKFVIDRFKAINEMNSNIKCVLLFPGKLTEQASALLIKNSVEIWDIDYLASYFKNEIVQTSHPIFQSLFTKNIISCNKDEEYVLIEKLKTCKPGKENWSRYQKLIGEILSFLFCPPLLQPLSEKSDAAKINRRDFIFPNYCETGFWAYLRSRYCADYIVVDAKIIVKG